MSLPLATCTVGIVCGLLVCTRQVVTSRGAARRSCRVGGGCRRGVAGRRCGGCGSCRGAPSGRHAGRYPVPVSGGADRLTLNADQPSDLPVRLPCTGQVADPVDTLFPCRPLGLSSGPQPTWLLGRVVDVVPCERWCPSAFGGVVA